MSVLNYANLEPKEFESLAKDVMEKILGIPMERFGDGKDGGVDLTEESGNRKIIVQCKRYCSSLTGFASSDAAVMIIQGAEDDQVPTSLGYDLYQEKYGGDTRFTFLLRENRGHDNIYWSDEAIDYQKNFNLQFQEACSREPEMTDEEFDAWHLEYLQKNLNRDIWDHVIDEELFQSISEFYREHN